MWLAGSEPLDVYLGTRGWAACRGRARVEARPAEGFESALSGLRSWIGTQPKGMRLRVWLSGGLCRPFLHLPVAGVRSAAERLRVAHVQGAQATGLDGPCRVWLDEGPGDLPVVGAAMPEAVLEAVASSVAGHRLLSLRPWWAGVLEVVLRAQPGVTALAIHDVDSQVLLTGDEGRFEHVRVASPVLDRTTADAVLARQLMSADVVPGAERVVRLGLQASQQPSALAVPLAALVEAAA